MNPSIDKLEGNEKSFINSFTSFEDIGNKADGIILTREDVELFLNFFNVLAKEVSSIVQNWQEMSKESQSQYGKTLDVYRAKLLNANSLEEEKYWNEELKKAHGQLDKHADDNTPQNVIHSVCAGLGACFGIGVLIWALSNNNKQCAMKLNTK